MIQGFFIPGQKSSRSGSRNEIAEGEGVSDGVGVSDGLNVSVALGVSEGVCVLVGVGVLVRVGRGVLDGVGVAVRVFVGVGVWQLREKKILSDLISSGCSMWRRAQKSPDLLAVKVVVTVRWRVSSKLMVCSSV